MLAYSLAVVRCLRPDMALFARAVVEAVMLTEGSIGSADEVAQRLGLANRFKLARLLRQEGLPPLHRLAEWAMLESWVTTAERDHVSLCHIAIHSKRHPSACYRLVKGLTGFGWEEVRVLGTAWVQNEFSNRLRRCGRLADRTSIVGAQLAAPLPDATTATAARSV
jgi:hypothetical protein